MCNCLFRLVYFYDGYSTAASTSVMDTDDCGAGEGTTFIRGVPSTVSVVLRVPAVLISGE